MIIWFRKENKIIDVSKVSVVDTIYLNDLINLHYLTFEKGTVIELTAASDNSKMYIVLNSSDRVMEHMKDLYTKERSEFGLLEVYDYFERLDKIGINKLTRLAKHEYMVNCNEDE